MTSSQSVITEMPAGAEALSLAQERTQHVKAAGHPRMVLLGADYLNSNLGVRALTTGAVTAIVAQHPNAAIQILEYGTVSAQFQFDLPQGRVTVPMLNIRFSKRIWSRNHIARLIVTALLLKAFPGSLRMIVLSRNRWLRELARADTVLALSGGDSFSDIYGVRRLIYMSLPQILTLLLGKNLIQLPQTIGPFERRISRSIARWILSRSARIYSRDEQAVPRIRLLLQGEARDRVRFCPDLGFAVPAKTPARTEIDVKAAFSHRPVVGMNVSGLLYMGGYSRKNMFVLRSSYKAVVEKTIELLIRKKGATVLLVPHVATQAGEGDTSACLRILRELGPRYPGRIYAVQDIYDEREIKSIIAQCDLFVGARMHSCIAALSQSVPTIAMAYSDKFAGVFRCAGTEDAVVDLRALSAGQVIARVASLYGARAVMKARVQAAIPQVEKRVFDLFRTVESSPYEA